MIRYTVVFVLLLVNNFCSSIPRPRSASVGASLDSLQTKCGNGFIANQIKSKIEECSFSVITPYKEKALQCLIFYDINYQLCSNDEVTKFSFDFNEEVKKLDGVEDTSQLCTTTSTWRTTNFTEYPFYKHYVDISLHNHDLCIKLCSNDDALGLKPNFFCKYFTWGSTILKSHSAKPQGIHADPGPAQPNPSSTNKKVEPSASVGLSGSIGEAPKAGLSISKPENANAVSQVEGIPSEQEKPVMKKDEDKIEALAPNMPEQNVLSNSEKHASTKVGQVGNAPVVDLVSVSVLKPVEQEQPLETKNENENVKTPAVSSEDPILGNANKNTAKLNTPEMKNIAPNNVEKKDDQKETAIENPKTKQISEEEEDDQEDDDVKEDVIPEDEGEVIEDPTIMEVDLKKSGVRENVPVRLQPAMPAFNDQSVADSIIQNPETYGELDTDDHFFSFFLTAIIMVVLFYVLYHNKSKCLGLIVEGRQPGRRRNSRGHAYRRLDTLEQAMSSNSAAPPSKIIY